MRIDYVMPTWNSAETLEIALKSIREYGNPNEIIVIDRCSTDKTIEIAKKYNCKIIISDKSLGGARYEATQAATTEYIGFVDSDVEITKDWQKLLDYKWPEDCGIVGGYVHNAMMWENKPPFKVKQGAGFFGCSITKRDLILECVDIKEYSGSEDTCYSFFLKSKGLSWYVEDTMFYHHSEPPLRKQTWYGAGNRLYYGLRFSLLKKLIGGAIFGIPQRHPDDSYLENWLVRLQYLKGYLFPERYIDYDRRV